MKTSKSLSFAIALFALGVLVASGCSSGNEGQVLTKEERAKVSNRLSISPVAAFPGQGGKIRLYGEITNIGKDKIKKLGFVVVGGMKEKKDVAKAELLDLEPNKPKSFDLQTDIEPGENRVFTVRVDSIEIEQ
ncbi:MAG: hypothetical protein ACYC1U_01345 [Candidatus Aquicultorales bacterium]